MYIDPYDSVEHDDAFERHTDDGFEERDEDPGFERFDRELANIGVASDY